MLQRKSTGVQGLDEMVQGGIPEARIVLLGGGPGSGKTILSLHFLMEGIRQGEKCLYVTLEEPLANLKENVAAFGWDLEKQSNDDKLILIDSSHMVYSQPERVYLQKIPFVDTLEKLLQQVKVDRLVLDPINSITIQCQSSKDKREMVSKIFTILRNSKVTAIVTLEADVFAPDFYMEKYLADGSIALERVIDSKFRLVKTLRVEKMRGVQCDDQPRTYTIGEHGFKVYHTEPVVTE